MSHPTTPRLPVQSQLVVLCSVLTLGLSGCGGGSSTGPNNNGGNNGSGTYALTITVKALDAGYIPGIVYTYIGDNIETRSDMPQLLDENNATVKPFGQNQKTITLNVPAGKYVTLFAVEFGRASFNGSSNGVVSRLPLPSETEFTGWSGATGRLVSAEAGVASIRMDANAAVTAEFRKLEGVMVQFEGCMQMDIGFTTPPYLGFGTTQGETVTPTGAYYGLNSETADWTYAYGKQGTSFKFVAEQFTPPPAGTVKTAFLSWQGNAATANCGGYTCDVIVPPVGVSAATLISKNSWLAITLGAAPTIGCGTCVVASGWCSLRP